MREINLSDEGKRRIIDAYLPSLRGAPDDADLDDVIASVHEWLMAGEYGRGVLIGELGLHRHPTGELCVHDSRPTGPYPPLDAIRAYWPDVIGTLTGVPRGVLCESLPIDLVDGLLGVQVSAPLVSSAERYRKVLADAIVAVTGVTLEPIFSAKATD